jgi:hypothetical protein
VSVVIVVNLSREPIYDITTFHIRKVPQYGYCTVVLVDLDTRQRGIK